MAADHHLDSLSLTVCDVCNANPLVPGPLALSAGLSLASTRLGGATVVPGDLAVGAEIGWSWTGEICGWCGVLRVGPKYAAKSTVLTDATRGQLSAAQSPRGR